MDHLLAYTFFVSSPLLLICIFTSIKNKFALLHFSLALFVSLISEFEQVIFKHADQVFDIVLIGVYGGTPKKILTFA